MLFVIQESVTEQEITVLYSLILYTLFLKSEKMRLNSIVPNFKAETTHGPIQFYEWQGNS